MANFDPRINAFRADLAAEALKGAVDAQRFVEGKAATVQRGTVSLRKHPQVDAGMQTQLLYGERFTVYDEQDGWAWGQAELDHYVGYVKAGALLASSSDATHRVTVLATPVLPAPDIKRAALDLLPMNAKVRMVEKKNRFAKIEDGRFVYAAHLVPHSDRCKDWVGVAENFLGVPYLWGGKTNAGCDCSGLVQTALEMAGIAAPRDTDMMEQALGRSLELSDSLEGLLRGDLVFWKGHMGVMLDAKRLLHANVFHMQVAIEPLREAVERIAQSEGAIRKIKRML
ncbi:MAG: NlpC/P60 family protein [Micropepsaceae bacterium]